MPTPRPNIRTNGTDRYLHEHMAMMKYLDSHAGYAVSMTLKLVLVMAGAGWLWWWVTGT
jgi:hypothetical protein